MTANQNPVLWLSPEILAEDASVEEPTTICTPGKLAVFTALNKLGEPVAARTTYEVAPGTSSQSRSMPPRHVPGLGEPCKPRFIGAAGIIGAGVGVAVGVLEGVGVCVGVGVLEGVGVCVGVGVLEGVGVLVGVPVLVGVGVGVAVARAWEHAAP